ncbi:MAG: lysyl oxidase family protein [Phycisphaerales bacterium]
MNARLLTAALAACAAPALAQSELLPDIVVDQDRLFDNYVTTSGGQTYLRLSNGTANIGPGKFHVYGGADNGDGTQDVWQRVFNDDGSYTDYLASKFIYHPTHGHIHLENWASYRLREVLPGDGVGDIVAQGEKTSFCILDLGVYDTSLPNYNPSGEFFSCSSQTQGLSVGWIDVYSSGLSGQEINITGVPEGLYWLESVVDPDNVFIEATKDNNVARIKVSLGNTDPGTLEPDDYEPNNMQSVVAARPVGQVNSPNLGPANPQLVISSLTIDESGDDDFFRFYLPATGTSSDFVRVTFSHSQGDVDMRLKNDSGSTLETSQSTSNAETISLQGRGPGWFAVEVYGFNGDTCPNYELTIDPPSASAPSIDVLNPPAGDIQLIHGAENYTATWSASDPNGNPTWVSVWANTSPTFDGNELFLPTSINTDGSLGMYVINSAYLDEATYWIYAEVTNGGATAGEWSDGTLTFTPFCIADLDGNGTLNVDDIDLFVSFFLAGDLAVDFDGNGALNVDDIDAFIAAFLDGCP